MRAFIVSFCFFFSGVKDWGPEEGKRARGVYLGPRVLRLTEIQGSLVVSLDPESVIICLWGHKEPTEPRSGKQRNTDKEVRATKSRITDPKNGALGPCLSLWQWGGNTWLLCHVFGQSPLDAAFPAVLAWLSISAHLFALAQLPEQSCRLWESRSRSVGLPGGLAEITHLTQPVQSLVHGRNSINTKYYSHYYK